MALVGPDHRLHDQIIDQDLAILPGRDQLEHFWVGVKHELGHDPLVGSVFLDLLALGIVENSDGAVMSAGSDQ